MCRFASFDVIVRRSSYTPPLMHRRRCYVSATTTMSETVETRCGILVTPRGYASWRVVAGKLQSEMTTEERFGEKWKELEAAVRLAFPTWDGRTVENFLKQMRVEGVDFTRLMALRMARNALTHNPMLNGKPIVTLNEGVLPFLDDVIARIKILPTAANILIPRDDVFSGSLSDMIHDVVDTMLEKVFSHVPVLDSDDRVIGVFSESTMLEMSKAGIQDEGNATLGDVSQFLPCDKHTAEVFRFVPKNDPIAHLRHLCAEALGNHKRIGMFFVTENGKEDEPLLGILTVWDIAGVADVTEGIFSLN